MKTPITEEKSLPSTDIRLFLTNKKNFPEARAAAGIPPYTPTPVRETSTTPSHTVQSARSIPDRVPGGSITKPNVMTQQEGEEHERTITIGYNQTE